MKDHLFKRPQFVGHRGFPEIFPENCLSGLVAAFEHGADAVELDVQFTKDKVPVVCHDDTIDRVSNQSASVFSLTMKEMEVISCGEVKRFGEQYKNENFSSLFNACQSLAVYEKPVFIEIKEESILKYGVDFCLERVLMVSNVLGKNRIIISFNAEIIKKCAEMNQFQTGWVIAEYDYLTLLRAINVAPDFLICNFKKIPQGIKLQKNNWRWFLYDIVDGEVASAFFNNGVDYIETWNVKKMMDEINL